MAIWCGNTRRWWNTERRTRTEPWPSFHLPRQSQHTFRDDVALDLIRSTTDRRHVGVQRAMINIRRARILASIQKASGAQNGGHDPRILMQDARHGQLAERHDR